MIALRVTRRPGATEPDAAALPMPPEGLTIGRSTDCAVVLADPLRLVSRQHAQVIAVGGSARVRCISSRTPLWVNGVQLDPGGERVLSPGDRLRIGGFELAVESLVAGPGQRSRLDRWFDLEGAPDPLAAGSALPTLEALPDAPAVNAVVSWQTDGHVVRAGTAVAPIEPVIRPAAAPLDIPAMPPAPTQLHAPRLQRGAGPGAAAAETPLPPQTAKTAQRPQTPQMPQTPQTLKTQQPPQPPQAAPARAPATSTSAPGDVDRRPEDGQPDLRELARAFARGAGLGPEVAPLTPEWMEHLGALLRATAEGTLALLQSRAVTKRQMRAEGTHIAPRQNNPLKFSPDATEALTRMLQREASPGFLDPVAALHDAHHDLLVHQVAMVAGMRAAVFQLFSRLGPEAAESGEGPAHGISRLPLLRAAALWHRHRMQHAQLLEHLDDDFETIFGREFLRAYEAQSRDNADAGARPDGSRPDADPHADPNADPPPPEEPWPIYAR